MQKKYLLPLLALVLLLTMAAFTPASAVMSAPAQEDCIECDPPPLEEWDQYGFCDPVTQENVTVYVWPPIEDGDLETLIELVYEEWGLVFGPCASQAQVCGRGAACLVAFEFVWNEVLGGYDATVWFTGSLPGSSLIIRGEDFEHKVEFSDNSRGVGDVNGDGRNENYFTFHIPALPDGDLTVTMNGKVLRLTN